MKSLSTSSKEAFSSRSQNIVTTVTLFKTLAENIVLVISFLMSFYFLLFSIFISFYVFYCHGFIFLFLGYWRRYFLTPLQTPHKTREGWVGYKRQILSHQKDQDLDLTIVWFNKGVSLVSIAGSAIMKCHHQDPHNGRKADRLWAVLL